MAGGNRDFTSVHNMKNAVSTSDFTVPKPTI